MWGLGCAMLTALLYPPLSGLIEKIPPRIGIIFSNCLIIFMIFNMIISSLALTRYTERNTPGNNQSVMTQKLTDFLDTRFHDERMGHIYPNAKVVIDGVPQRITPQ